MRRWLIAGGLAAYILGLLVAAPASLQDAALNKASDGRLRLAEAQGSLWSGSGQFEIRDAGARTDGGSVDAGKTIIAKSLAWRFRPAYLLRGQLRAEIRLDQRDKPFIVTASLSGIEVEDADIELPARALILGVPKLAALGLTGDMALRVAHLSVGHQGMQGNATLEWRSAGSVLTRVSPLGDYELRLEGEGAALHASLRTLKGPLQLDGQGSWPYGNNPVFLATARMLPQHVEQLAPLLRLIAIERGDGSFVLQLK
jgi:general secretion pathway protein N